MPNHLTPEELSKELGIDRQEVIKVCVQESIPIYQGKIDKTLFQAQLQALGAVRLLTSSQPLCGVRAPSRTPSPCARPPRCAPAPRRRCA